MTHKTILYARINFCSGYEISVLLKYFIWLGHRSNVCISKEELKTSIYVHLKEQQYKIKDPETTFIMVRQ